MNSKYIYLSYFLNSNTPLYGGDIGINIIKDRSIQDGDTSNTKRLEFHNHSGTHIDFPNHFIDDGKRSSDYKADFWIFNHPFVVKLQVGDAEIIDFTEFTLASIPVETDFLILNTEFYKYRNEERFWNTNPGIAPELAGKLKGRCPNLRVLGMDTISLTSFQHRELGRVSHRKFLGEYDILLVEDMKLDQLTTIPVKINCFPLLVENIDGAPVTIIAEI
jgi:kynurenine formamidase